MKQSITLAAAALFASTVFAGPALSQDNGNGAGNGNVQIEAPGASGAAPGQMKLDDENARDYAPGRSENPPPGQAMRDLTEDDQAGDGDVVENADGIDEGTTASIDQNYGDLISQLRSGKMGDVTNLSSDTEVTIVEVDDVVPNGNRTALDNALAAKADDISRLRTDLGAAEIDALAQVDLETVVAAQVGDDGGLTVYVDAD